MLPPISKTISSAELVKSKRSDGRPCYAYHETFAESKDNICYEYNFERLDAPLVLMHSIPLGTTVRTENDVTVSNVSASATLIAGNGNIHIKANVGDKAVVKTNGNILIGGNTGLSAEFEAKNIKIDGTVGQSKYKAKVRITVSSEDKIAEPIYKENVYHQAIFIYEQLFIDDKLFIENPNDNFYTQNIHDDNNLFPQNTPTLNAALFPKSAPIIPIQPLIKKIRTQASPQTTISPAGNTSHQANSALELNENKNAPAKRPAPVKRGKEEESDDDEKHVEKKNKTDGDTTSNANDSNANDVLIDQPQNSAESSETLPELNALTLPKNCPPHIQKRIYGLHAALFEWHKAYKANNGIVATKKNFNLRFLQLRVMTEYCNALMQRENGHLNIISVQATGSGKTVTFAKMLEAMFHAKADNSKKRILILTSRIELIQQILKTFKEHAPNLTASETDKTHVTVMSYQAWQQKHKEWQENQNTFYSDITFIICDEAHNLMSPTRVSYIKTIIAKFKEIDIWLFTATAKYNTKKNDGEYKLTSLAELLNCVYKGEANPTHLAVNPITPNDIPEAIQQKILTPVRTAVLKPDFTSNAKVKDAINAINAGLNNNIVDEDEETNSQFLAQSPLGDMPEFNNLAVYAYIEGKDPVTRHPLIGQQALVFCFSVNHAEKVAAQFNNYSPLLAHPFVRHAREKYVETMRKKHIEKREKQKKLQEELRQISLTLASALAPDVRKEYEAKKAKIKAKLTKYSRQGKFDEEFYRSDFQIAAAMSGRHGKMLRKKLFKKFKNGGVLIFTGDQIFKEGFDHPPAKIEINLAPTKSLVAATQRGGRVLRVVYENGNVHYCVAYVIDIDLGLRGQIFFPHILNGEHALGEFKAADLYLSSALPSDFNNYKNAYIFVNSKLYFIRETILPNGKAELKLEEVPVTNLETFTQILSKRKLDTSKSCALSPEEVLECITNNGGHSPYPIYDEIHFEGNLLPCPNGLEWERSLTTSFTSVKNKKAAAPTNNGQSSREENISNLQKRIADSIKQILAKLEELKAVIEKHDGLNKIQEMQISQDQMPHVSAHKKKPDAAEKIKTTSKKETQIVGKSMSEAATKVAKLQVDIQNLLAESLVQIQSAENKDEMPSKKSQKTAKDPNNNNNNEENSKGIAQNKDVASVANSCYGLYGKIMALTNLIQGGGSALALADEDNDILDADASTNSIEEVDAADLEKRLSKILEVAENLKNEFNQKALNEIANMIVQNTQKNPEEQKKAETEPTQKVEVEAPKTVEATTSIDPLDALLLSEGIKPLAKETNDNELEEIEKELAALTTKSSQVQTQVTTTSPMLQQIPDIKDLPSKWSDLTTDPKKWQDGIALFHHLIKYGQRHEKDPTYLSPPGILSERCLKLYKETVRFLEKIFNGDKELIYQLLPLSRSQFADKKVTISEKLNFDHLTFNFTNCLFRVLQGEKDVPARITMLYKNAPKKEFLQIAMKYTDAISLIHDKKNRPMLMALQNEFINLFRETEGQPKITQNINPISNSTSSENETSVNKNIKLIKDTIAFLERALSPRLIEYMLPIGGYLELNHCAGFDENHWIFTKMTKMTEEEAKDFSFEFKLRLRDILAGIGPSADSVKKLILGIRTSFKENYDKGIKDLISYTDAEFHEERHKLKEQFNALLLKEVQTKNLKQPVQKSTTPSTVSVNNATFFANSVPKQALASTTVGPSDSNKHLNSNNQDAPSNLPKVEGWTFNLDNRLLNLPKCNYFYQEAIMKKVKSFIETFLGKNIDDLIPRTYLYNDSYKIELYKFISSAHPRLEEQYALFALDVPPRRDLNRSERYNNAVKNFFYQTNQADNFPWKFFQLVKLWDELREIKDIPITDFTRLPQSQIVKPMENPKYRL